MSRRIGLSTLGALVALVITVAGFARAPEAVAVQGEPVIAGENNFETVATRIWNLGGEGSCPAETADGGLIVCGDDQSGFGIAAEGADVGVQGEADSGGTGLFGTHTGSSGIGVHGRTGGEGSAVYGEATQAGAGVFGDSTDGVGVQARSTNGPALNVLGKARFSRSGIVTVAAGRTSRTVNMAGVTTSSMVLATAQQIAPVYVKAVVPGTNMFVIRLTNVAPTGGLKVAYFVLN